MKPTAQIIQSIRFLRRLFLFFVSLNHSIGWDFSGYFCFFFVFVLLFYFVVIFHFVVLFVECLHFKCGSNITVLFLNAETQPNIECMRNKTSKKNRFFSLKKKKKIKINNINKKKKKIKKMRNLHCVRRWSIPMNYNKANYIQ